ncbi:MAG: transglycosylase SLT domain-containing protein [Pseudomonadota bacterium]
MNLLTKQIEVRDKIREVAQALGVNPAWAVSVAMTESSLGMKQKSPTGCRGVFQMSGIAMKDLLQEMEKADDEIIDIACGVAFLHLLLDRHKTIEKATGHFCDPKDRDFYIARVKEYMGIFK